MLMFASHSATKALYHVTKTSGGNICTCRSRNIDSSFEEAYKTLMRSKNHKHSSKVAASENLASAAAQHNITVSNILEDSWNKKQHANSSSKTGNYGCESSNILSYLNQQRNSYTITSSTSITNSICSSIGGM